MITSYSNVVLLDYGPKDSRRHVKWLITKAPTQISSDLSGCIDRWAVFLHGCEEGTEDADSNQSSQPIFRIMLLTQASAFTT
jgi:hypothetical protein